MEGTGEGQKKRKRRDSDDPAPAPEDPLRQYRRDVGREPLLSFEQEVELAKRAEAGDETARQRLVEANLRLVLHIATRYARRGQNLPDLVQAGNMALMQASEKYDWRKGYRFSSYAWKAIRRAIVHALLNIDRSGTSSLQTHTLDEDSGESGTLETVVEDRSVLDPEEAVAAGVLKKKLESALQTLTPQEREVLKLRYGLEDGHERTLEEVADELGMARECIKKIYDEALQKLRRSDRAKDLKDFLV